MVDTNVGNPEIKYSVRQLLELRESAKKLGFWDDVEHWNQELRRLGYEN